MIDERKKYIGLTIKIRRAMVIITWSLVRRIPSAAEVGHASLVWNSQEIQSDNRNSTEPIGGFHRPLKLAPGTNLLKLLISSRGRSKPTDRFRRIPALGSHRIPTLGIRMSAHNPESDLILPAGWIRSDSLTWISHNIQSDEIQLSDRSSRVPRNAASTRVRDRPVGEIFYFYDRFCISEKLVIDTNKRKRTSYVLWDYQIQTGKISLKLWFRSGSNSRSTYQENHNYERWDFF